MVDFDNRGPICYRCRQHGHMMRDCTVNLSHSKRFYIDEEPSQYARIMNNNLSRQPSKKKTSMVGSSNEVELMIGDHVFNTLLDTGSSISTISKAAYDQYLSAYPLEPITELLTVTCADGEALPYLGFISVPISTGNNSLTDEPLDAIFLIVPDTAYHSDVPVLLGTNILDVMWSKARETCGNKLTTPWYLALRCISIREKELARNHHALALVKCAAKESITVPPNSEVTVQGYMCKQIPTQPMCAILHSSPKSKLSSDLDISPFLVTYRHDDSDLVPVSISNVTTLTAVIRPHDVLCEIQPVNVQCHMNVIDDTSASTCDTILGMNIAKDELTETQTHEVEHLLQQYDDILSRADDDIGHYSEVKHRIELSDSFPFKQRYRRIPPSMFNEVRDHLQQLLSAGIIRRSHSPFTSNVVLAKKKDGKLRLCIDFRQLNNHTIKDNYALPRIDEILESLSGNRYFSVLDMKSGYHQIEIEESHKERTAFTVGPLGFYEYNRMPFGLTNAPATYQRVMEACLGDLHLNICHIYLDDLIVYGRTFEEHLDRLQRVFQKLREAGLKLTPKKCHLFKGKVKYVGHIVSAEEIEPDPEKIQKAMDWPTPTSKEEVRPFLGFIGYYRKFVKDFSKTAKPLTNLLPPTRRKGTRKKKDEGDNPFVWNDSQEGAFQSLKSQLIKPPILGYPDYELPFELHTDASTKGLGAVLYQQQGEHKRVISYASRGLSKSEQHYPAHKLEFLSLKWAVTEKFTDYLFGHQFTVYTDNNPLTYVLTSAQLDATGHPWVAALSAYSFELKYRPGRSNADADAMSRLPGILSEHRDTIRSDSIQAICQSHQVNSNYIESLSTSPEVVDNTFILNQQPTFPKVDVKSAQENDPELSLWFDFVRDRRRPSKHHLPYSTWQSVLQQNFDRLRLHRGILHREITIDGESKLQQILPSSLIPDVLYYLHDQFGHQGRDRTTSLVKERFFWPGMSKDIEQWLANCGRCVRRKSPTNTRAPLCNITTSEPLELVCIDYLLLDKCKGGFEYVLVITDHFTKYSIAVPTRNQTAKTTAEALFRNFIIHYGIPQKFHSDQGANFESKVIRELYDLLNISKSRTTPYHPMGNGQCERFNRTLISMLGTLKEDQKRDWKSFIGPIVHAYNCTRHDSTGVSPYLLMFGRDPRLPIDAAFGTSHQQKQPSTKYVDSLRSRMYYAYEIAKKNDQRAQEKQKRNYDVKVNSSSLDVGDKVLVKVVKFDGRHKLMNRREEDIYLITSKPNPDVPVYEVRKENGSGRSRVLHRNLLLPVGSRELDDREEQKHDETQIRKKPTPKPRRIGKSTPSTDTTEATESSVPQTEEDHADSEDPDDIVLVRYPVTCSGDTTSSSADTGDRDDTTIEQSPSADTEETSEDRDTASGTNEESVTETANDESATAADAESNDDRSVAEPESANSAVSDTDTQEDPPRRSGRQTRQPVWTKDYHMCMNTVASDPDWKIRADYLKELARSELFSNPDNTAVTTAFLHLITEK